ncbi:tail fiber domain-containing protein [Spirosoma koreense]
MKHLVLAVCSIVSWINLYAQVGIGTTTPKAFFNVAEGKDVLFGKDLSYPIEDDDLDRAKLIWYASKGAFRAGNVSYTKWDIGQVGYSSFAAGYNPTASGAFTVALGFSSLASGYGSIAIGQGSASSKDHSVAIGQYTTASGDLAVALGAYSTASGAQSAALGHFVTASGDNSSALGNKVTTNAKTGAFIIGDYDPNGPTYSNTATNQMMMRFTGGYTLYTSAPTSQSTALGIRLPANGNAWQTLSDSTRKENFRQADGVSFLQKIARMRLGSWNYKGQDAHQYRHYGPMAQDFFAAFGQDELGTIGEDKSINQADFDGVNLIAIQALINENQELKAKLAAFEEREKNAQARLDRIERLLSASPAASMASSRP